MRNRYRLIGEAEEKQLSLAAYFSEINDNTDNVSKRERMKKLIGTAIKNELTQRQRDCICMRYYQGMRAEEIAYHMSISKASVYKHIRKGLAAIRRCTVYL